MKTTKIRATGGSTAVLRLTALALALAIFAPSAARADEAVDAALAKMAQASGAEYVEARQVLTAREGVSVELDKVLEGRWTDDNFQKLAMATIVKAHVARPDLVEKVNHLRGLDPSFYTQRRKPDPEVASELRRFGAEAVGPMLELYLKTGDGYAFSKDDAEKAAKEKLALRIGIVIALSVSNHPSAYFVCRDVARNASEAEGVRIQAIEGLGDVGTRPAFAELTRIFADREAFDENLRLAAIRGVGSVPSASALEFLKERLASEDAAERKTAVVSIGLLGSSWGWEARGEAVKATGDAIRRDAAAALIGVVDRLGEECGDQIVDALATIAHESALELLTQKAVENATAKRALERVKIVVERNSPTQGR